MQFHLSKPTMAKVKLHKHDCIELEGWLHLTNEWNSKNNDLHKQNLLSQTHCISVANDQIADLKYHNYYS